MDKRYPMIVKFTVKENQINFVKDALLKLLIPTRKENGCLLYELHQDRENPRIFMFYEIWESKAHWQTHDKSDHVQDFLKITKDAFESVDVNKLTII